MMSARENQQAEIYALTAEALQLHPDESEVALPVDSLDDTLPDDFILTELRATNRQAASGWQQGIVIRKLKQREAAGRRRNGLHPDDGSNA